MSFTDATYLSDAVQDVLSAVSSALTAAGRPVDRVVRFTGLPSWDCEMLAGWADLRWATVGTGSSGDPVRQGRHVADVSLLLLRSVCVFDADNIPAASVIDADGVAFLTDEWVMQRSVVEGLSAGTLFSGCTVVSLTGVRSSQPQGGLSGMTMTIGVALG